MNTLWQPEHTPPQIDSTVADTIKGRILEIGLTRVYAEAMPIVGTRQPFLGTTLNGVKVEGLKDKRPLVALKAAVAITTLAYWQSGYDQQVAGDALVIADMEASLAGAEPTFLTSYWGDEELTGLMGTLTSTPEFQDGAAEYVYPEILALGSGFVRHNLQMAVTAP
ncbi:MAG TPA: hypothetical protein VM124_03985 [Candidatus Limnocylindrales bacterium]|nr:hypothetical protein [Candidatus Limnocylindrales bacterium]